MYTLHQIIAHCRNMQKHLGKCMFNIHTYMYATHESVKNVCQKAWYYHKWPTGLSWWCQIHPFLVEILLSNSMLREWPTGQSSCRIVGGVNPPQLLKSILRKYEVAQEEQWICLGSFLLLMEEILPWKGYCIFLSYVYVDLHSTTL